MSFVVWPPEVNSSLLLDGPGAGPMLEAAAAWDGIGNELSVTATTFTSVTTDLAGQAWQGPTSAAMTGAAARYADWLGGAAAQAQQSAAQARGAATAFEGALATILNPDVIATNRGELASLVLTNLFGQNAPAIAATEADYEQMWAHNVAVMSGYHANASATVAALGQWQQALEDLPGLNALAKGFNGALTSLYVDLFGWPAQPPFSATQGGGFSGTPSLATRLEEGALLPVKPFLDAFPQLAAQLSVPNSPFLSLFNGNNPLFSLFLSNSPPQFLTFLLGETVQYGTYNGMSVVQITPAHPSGNYVVAIHGGAFIFSPSLFHWLDYTVMAHQTGATIEVPIYPLLQQGGTAGTVVPTMAGLISSEVNAHGAPHVSVIGDSAGGNLALAATEYMVTQGDQVPGSMVLLSPWLDLTMTNPNIAYVQDPLLPVGPAQQIGRVWAGNLSVTNPEVSPLYGSLSGLPRTTVYSGNLDILSPDVLVLEQHAAVAGAPFSFVLANGEIHDWIILTPDGPQYWPQIDQELGI